MFGTKSAEVPDTNDTSIFDPATERPDIDDKLVFSTPRSELNNPMPESGLLAEAGDGNKDRSDPAANPAKKLSQAGASASLFKRADPKDLPSYPSRGLQNLETSAGKAALLAAKSKSPEPWKPADRLPAAGAAASLANAVKSPEVWNPGPLPTATAAALLAGDAHKTPEIWRPATPSKSATKAAGNANGKASVDLTPRSPPVPASASNALTAAGLATQASPKKASLTAFASPPTPAYDITKINALAAQNAQARLASALPRPSPSQAQIDKNMADVLRAASVSMSKKTSQSSQSRPSPPVATSSMPPSSYYSHIPTSPPKVSAADPTTKKINRQSSVAAASIAASHDLHAVMSSEVAEDRQMRYYPHLEEAARKAAAERLSRVQAEHDKARKASGLPPSWQTSGPYTKAITKQPANKPTTQSKSQVDAADYARSLKIKSDTAKLANQMDSVDKDRQARDYLALLSVAEKNVRSRMQELETKVAEHQGRVPKHVQAEWDAKAKIMSEEYERKRNADREAKKGKIDMGGGLWYDREDLERIARGNVQPILDEINEKAQKERARTEQQKMDREQAEREKRVEAERLAETKAEMKKAKATEKAAAKSRRDAEKAEERQRKAELKESQRQEKERLKASKQTQRATAPAANPDGVHDSEDDEDELENPSDSRSDSDMTELEPRPMSQAGHARVEREREMHEAAKRERGWFGSIQKRLVRRGSASKQDADQPGSNLRDLREGFDDDEDYEVSSLSSGDRASARDVAFAGAATSAISDEDDGTGGGLRRNSNNSNLDSGAGARQRYISSSDSGSTSSGDLYTVSPPYKPLTSATYTPGLAGEDDMPAFIPERAAFSASNGGDGDVGSGSGDMDAGAVGEVSAVGKHDTFGNTLAERVSVSFDSFAAAKQRDENAEEEAKIETVTDQSKAAESLSVPALAPGFAAADAAGRASATESRSDVRSSRFSEML
ncbi:hypothetical protein Dda_1999 [Drechslerella dactyloides]|uniref:Eisosome protein 1 n=1 Tax=Drechslerella dactyloides TaxID=74499 RepID=A0AAD6J3K9_DREDA|nr:hypothetical protein Dda_1999 [Drechslerella dactyloides]